MESAALVSGEYSSGDENETCRAKDVNYDEVGMDMGSSASESENEGNLESKETHPTVRDGLFSSKEEYDAYQNQFKVASNDEISTPGSQNQEMCDSEYGTSGKNSNIRKQSFGDSSEKDEYGGYQPINSKTTKESSHPISSSPTREPRRRTDLINKNEDCASNEYELATEKQPNKR